MKRLNVVIEELKQRITPIAAKVRRHQGRIDSYRQGSGREVMMIRIKTVLGKYMESVCRL